MSENKINYTTKKTWEYSSDEQEHGLAVELLNKACLDQKKTLSNEEKSKWIKRLVATAKSNNLTLSSVFYLFYISWHEEKVALMPSQIARMLLGVSGIRYNVIFIHKDDEYDYEGYRKINYKKKSFNSNFTIKYSEEQNEKGYKQIVKFTDIENLKCIQVEVVLAGLVEYPAPIEVEEICRRASMTKSKNPRFCTWVQHTKAMIDKTVALKLAKDYKFYLDKSTGYNKPIDEIDPEEETQETQVSESVPHIVHQTAQVSESVPHIVHQTAQVSESDFEPDPFDEVKPAEEILVLVEKGIKTDPIILKKAQAMKDSGTVYKNDKGRLAINNAVGGEKVAREVIQSIWYRKED